MAEGVRRGVLTAGLVLACTIALAPAPSRAQSPDPAPTWALGFDADIFHESRAPLVTRIGGWIDASYEDSDLGGTTRSINVNHANVFADTRFRERWQLFVEGEFEYETALGGFEEEREYEIEQIYGAYRPSDRWRLRLGKFNTPFGFWTPVHWAILMDTIQPPLYEGLRLTPEQQQGFEIRGRSFPSWIEGHDLELRYLAFAGYGSGSALLDESGTDGLSFGADLRATLDGTDFAGVSVYQQDRQLAFDRRERSLVLYGQTELLPSLLLRGEYVHQIRERAPVPAPIARRADLAYVKLRWSPIERTYLNYRFDWGDDDTGGATSKHYVHTWTLGVEPLDGLRLKLEYATHELRQGTRPDFQYWGVSLGYLF